MSIRMKPRVKIDEHINFGEPSIDGIRTDVLKSRFLAGESVDYLVRDYELSRGKIEAAIRYELATPALRKKLNLG